MSIKTLVFILFLYIALVWVAAFEMRSGSDIQPFGLLWTAVGIAAVLFFVILSWIYGGWKVFRARARQKPPRPEKAVEKIHPEDAAISALIRAANTALAKLPRPGMASAKADIRQLPLYLLTGPEGAGKTSTFINSGLEPQLLAGRATDKRNPQPTEFMNLWFAGGAIFADVSGHAFSSGSDSWARLLSALGGPSQLSFWRRVFRGESPGATLGGVIAFCDVRELIGASADPQRFERTCRTWGERLRSIGEAFGVSFPLYQVITNCDAIPSFKEYFRRLPEGEIAQVLGGAIPAPAKNSGSAEPLARRLIASFRHLYRVIVERRVLYLAQEPDIRVRPSIYEFPRELKRIRSALVQFLTEGIHAGTAQPGPLLRGYYLTGVRETSLVPEPNQFSADWSVADLDASRYVRGDVTRMLRPDDYSVVGRPAIPGRTRWMFVADLFGKVIPSDSAAPPPPRRDHQVLHYRQAILAATACLCVIVCTGFAVSWTGNRSLLSDVESAATGAPAAAQVQPTLTALRALDRLRAQLQILKDGPGFSMHLGLYSGDRIAGPLRSAYFQRFQHLLLNPINSRMVETLDAADTGSSDWLYRVLKTHLMITSGVCEADPKLAAEVLRRENRAPADETDPAQWLAVAGRQIDFFAGELKQGNPCRLTEDTVACNRTREALRNIRGLNGIYSSIISRANETAGRPRRLSDLAPDYEQVLKGPSEVAAAFTPEGRDAVAKASKDVHIGNVDSCVLGSASSQKGDVNEIQRTYVRDYIEHWRQYLAGFEVVRYKSAQDAATKLAILADHKSPLLALFAMVGDATDFKPSLVSQVADKSSDYLKILGKSAAGKGANAIRNTSAGDPMDITQAFQPVHWVVPPGAETWVTDRNTAYSEALTQLGHSMQDLADNRTPADPAAFQKAIQDSEKALNAVWQIAKGFRPVESGDVDRLMQRLLEEPIQWAKPYITDPGIDARKKIESQFQSLCKSIGPTLHKYPFQNSVNDTTLTEFTSIFAPGTGAIWKFQAESLGDVIAKDASVKDATIWKVKDPSAKILPTAKLVNFINNAQEVTSAFFPAGSTSPHFSYVLRPKLDSSVAGHVIVTLSVDGQEHQWTNSYQAPFTWPAASGAKTGAVARVGLADFSAAFASRDGLWGIFRIIGDAEPRPLLSNVIEWKTTRGNGGRAEPMSTPVRLEIVEFPGGADVFNPKFYEALQCSGPAIQ